MFGLSHLNRAQRLGLGIVILLIVDVIWVVSSELTEYIFKNTHYNKPFFTTYIKTVMFASYLLGFLFWRPWRVQCCHKKYQQIAPADESIPIPSTSDPNRMIGSPIYVPVKYEDYSRSNSRNTSLNNSRNNSRNNSEGESDDAGIEASNKSVRFNNLSEVRQLSDEYAMEHKLARLSYQASVEVEEKISSMDNKLAIKQVLKLAFLFCILWFFANYTYQEALDQTEAAIVNVMSSTSGLFTLICAAIFPSSSGDKFTLSKLTAVLTSLGGIALVCISESKLEGSVPAGSLWALFSALLYSLYLVMVKRKVSDEDKMDIPMFFGFVGLICALLLWPGFFILHVAHEETFEWPTRTQWLFILINGAIGTVLSEFLWLWGCFLTSSLIGTLSLSLVVPLTMLADAVIKKVHYSLWFYLGTVPVFLSFFLVSLLTHWDSWDPVMLGLKKFIHCLCRRRPLMRVRDLDREQTTSLISEERPAIE